MKGMIYLKKYISYILAAILIINIFPVMKHKDISAKSILSDPTINSEGVATWDCVYFGRYPQSDATGELSDSIKWRVLSVSEDEALLMADSNLDVQRYNESFDKVTWENSTLRSWLNAYFFNRAFSNEEQNDIIDTAVENSRYNRYGIYGGNDTIDKVFVLSADEVMKEEYGFVQTTGENTGRVRRNTAYVAAGGFLSAEGSNAYEAGSPDVWWLRTAGENSYKAATVQFNGNISLAGDTVSLKNCVVCPVIKIDISGSLWEYAGTVNSNGEFNGPVEETTILDTVVEEMSTDEKIFESTTLAEAAVTEKATTAAFMNINIITTNNFKENRIKISKTKIKKAIKTKRAKSIKLSFRKVKNANRYQVAFSTTKRFKKILVKKIVNKNIVTVKNKRFISQNKLYVRVRAVVIKNGKRHYGKWSLAKRVRIE